MNPYEARVVREWPRFAISPEGQRARVDCMGDIPVGWHLEKPLVSDPAAPAVDITATLRSTYQTLTGKKPGPQWDAARLAEEISRASKGDV